MSKTYDLKVKEVIKETSDAVTIVLKNPLFSRIKYQSGQFLTLILSIGGEKIRRSYSLSSSPTVDESMAITVKKVANGLASNFICNQIKVGDKIDFLEPMGNFVVEPNKNNKRHVVLFATGSGITPLLSMAKTILAGEPNSIVSLIYGNRNENSIIFKQQLDELLHKYSEKLKVVHILSQPANSWNGFKGRIDKVLTVNVLNLLPKWEKSNTEYYLCGIEAMMAEVQEGLQKLQVPKDKIFKESFTVVATDEQKQAKATLANSLSTQSVTVLLDGQSYQVNVSPKSTILEAALDAGIDMPYSCQSGLCTACRGKCTSGKIKMDDCDGLSEKEIQQGYVLTCMSHPLTEDVTVEIG
jgi:ring-1,2-phenylacetyl-CoA epoxidase subunit PaaE